MKRKIYTILACIVLFVGCATTQNQSRFADNTFFCDNPKLKVQMLKNVIKQTEKHKQGSGWARTNHWFNIGSGEIVGVTIWRFRHNSNAEWRSSDERIIRNMGMVPLDRIIINDKTWVKFVDHTPTNYIGFGYFKRMGYNIVAVSCDFNNEKYKDEIENFKKTRVLTERHKKLINQAFDYIEKVLVIGQIRELQDKEIIQAAKVKEIT